jgi:carbamoyltransferase
MKDGEIVFALEEERLTRLKYDGAPLASIVKIKEYTDKLDYFVIAHTTPMTCHDEVKLDYCQDDPYYGLLRKLGLIDTVTNSWKEGTYRECATGGRWPLNVIDLGTIHHRLHAASAFYNSGFDTACAVIVDGAGSWVNFGVKEDELHDYWETETIFDCDYPHKFDTKYKHIGTKFATNFISHRGFNSRFWSAYGKQPDLIDWESKENSHHELVARMGAGIVKTYEAVTGYCGWPAIEAGKAMGLSPYGGPCDYLRPFFGNLGDMDLKYSDNEYFTPRYPNGALFQPFYEPEIRKFPNDEEGILVGEGETSREEVWELDSRANVAWRVQNDTQEQVLDLIRKSVRMTGKNNVVIAGGYGLNCVANYWYLDQLKDEGINVYVEPMSNDSGTAVGAAQLWHHYITKDSEKRDRITNLYYGPQYNHSQTEIEEMSSKYGAEISDADDKKIVDLILNKNIVALFQGRSESGPRALGNRSILYDPRDPDGKDHVNSVKHREFFRPFAGSILKEHVHEWFDLRGMDETPFMMYAVNCQPGIEEKIPAIIHVDKTCRIQTVTEEQNENYYKLIKEFFEQTGCPIIFNTSFNLGGEPLVETLDDALRTLANSDIEYLYLPEYGKLVTVKND